MAEDDEFAENIDNDATYFNEQSNEPHQAAIGVAGGYGDLFDDLEVNLQPPEAPADPFAELEDEVDRAEMEEQPRPGDEAEPAEMETEENVELDGEKNVERDEGKEERNVLTTREPSPSQGAVAKVRPDTPLSGKPKGGERWRLRVRMKDSSSRSASASPARASASRQLAVARERRRETSLASRRETGTPLREKTAEEETREAGGGEEKRRGGEEELEQP